MKTTNLIIICLSFSFLTNAQPGSLDKTFGDTGFVTKPINFQSSSIKVQNNENILAGGANVNGLAIVRYLKDGNIDYNFGDSGVASAPVKSEARSLIVTNDSAVIAVGGYADVTLVKFLDNGKIDSLFGNNGIATTDMAPYEYAYDVQLQADGKIIVSGITYDDPFNPQPHLFIERFNSDGIIDAGFGVNGRIINANLMVGTSTAKLVVQADDKIVIGGSAQFSEADFLVCRYNADGSLDESFGSNGVVITSYSNHNDYLNSLAIQPDGKIITAGQGDNFFINPTFGDMLLIRYNNDGEIDNSFGKNGYAIVKFKNRTSEIKSVLIQDNNQIIAVGNSYSDNSPNAFALARLSNTGILDSSFGIYGQQLAYYGENLYVTGGALQGNKIISGGYAVSNSIFHGVLARYNNNVSAPPTPIARIKRWLHKHGITWDDCPPSICDKITGYAVQRSSNGVNWATIFRSRAGANSQQPSAYSYADPSTLPGTNYYRLQTTSLDGAVAYSNVIAIENETSSITLSPNPARNILQIEGLSSSNKTKIMVVDLSGNLAISPKLVNNGAFSYNLNIATLKPGNYMLRIESNGAVVAKQFVKD